MRWFGLVVLLVFVDYVTKFLAFQYLAFESVKVLPFFSLTYACNSGAAFSLFTEFGNLLMWFSIAASILFAYLIYRVPHDRFWLGLAFTGILAGAVGNLIDRAFRGCVIDFLHFYVGDLSFPIFNVADTLITLGAITWLLVHFLHKEEDTVTSDTNESD
ncbi:MAG: signal peptidase II [Gammaproteobacteria bacterium]|nr:signal peptidase II [Gammaproteobacteria bacterium]